MACLQIEISCQGRHGTMRVLAQQVVCHCPDCLRLPPAERVFSCPQWEQHTGEWGRGLWRGL